MNFAVLGAPVKNQMKVSDFLARGPLVAAVFALWAAAPLAAQVSITSTSPLSSGTANNQYSTALAASGGILPYTWSQTAGQLPPGINLDGTGLLSGTPTVAGIYSVTIQVLDSSSIPFTDSKTFQISVSPTITTSSLPAGSVNQQYPATYLTAAGLSSSSPTWSATGLPTGLTVSTGGQLSGTPTVTGNFSPQFSVMDPTGPIGTAVIPLVINAAPVITDTSPLPPGYINSAIAYTYQFGSSSPVSGGTAPFGWSTTSTLPPGLSLTSGGLLSGTLTQTGLYTFNIKVTDSLGATGNKNFTLVVGTAPIQITTLRVPPVSTAGVSYPPPPPAAQTPYFQASLGTGNYTWSATGLPPGLALTPTTGNLTGITGTPTASGTFPVALTAADSFENTTINFSLTINPALSISSAPLAACTAGASCPRTLSVTGGTSPIIWTLSSGTLPPGLSLSSAGVISGTPNAVGSPTAFPFSVTATDSTTAFATQPLSLTVNPAITISPASLPSTTSGASYSQNFSTTGGTGAITFTGISLPGWLSLTSGGSLTGTAPAETSPTPFPFSVRATDANNAITINNYTVTVNPVPIITTTSPLPPWTVNRPYSQTINATGGTGSLTFSDAGATLPAWLNITSGGLLSGTPPASGPVNFTLKVTDSASQSSTKAFSLTINAAPAVTTSSLPAITSGLAYNQTLTESGGTSPFTWQIASAPAWLALSPAGALTGTAPVVASSTPFNFSVTVTDSTSAISPSQPLSITVNPPVTITTSNPLPTAGAGTPYSATFTSAGGTGSIAWTFTNLPAWLTASGATLTGTAPTPSQATIYNFNATATDSLGATSGPQPFSVTVASGVIIVTGATLGPWTATRPFSVNLTASGGQSPYTFTSANLPGWLGITGNTLSGTPPTPGPFTFSITATDSLSSSGSKNFSLTINPVPAVTTSTLPATTSGLIYSQPLAESGGTAPFTWQISSAPAWLNLSSGGVLSGTAPTVGAATPYNFSVTVTDSAGAISSSQPLSITVNPAVVITTTNPLPSVGSGGSYSVTFTSTGGTGAITWTFGNKPSWLTQNGATLSGTAPTPTQSTAYNFTATASDSLGATSGAQPFSVTVASGVIIVTGSTLGPWTATRPFSATLTASGGQAPYSFTSLNLPGWLTISGNTLSGTPPASGTFPFNITATDSLSSTGSKSFSLTINAVPAVTTTSLPATTSGLQYSQPLTLTGGTTPFTWSGSGLPPWLQVNGPAAVGTAPNVATSTPYPFTVSVTDGAGAVSDPQSLSVTVNPPVNILTTSPLPGATIGTLYSATFNGSGGTGALTWSGTSLPAWLSFNGNVLSGTPPTNAAGTTPTFTVRATDTLGAFASQTFQLSVSGTGQPGGGNLPSWTVNRTYTTTLTVTGGTAPYSNWSLSSGNLPVGLQLNQNTGVLSGSPGQTGAYTFTVTATDSHSVSFPSTWNLTINPAPAITTQSLPPASPATPYSQSLSRTGGTSPFTWTATGLTGSGLSLTTGGVLTGIPTATQPANIPFTATITDAAGATAQASLSVTVQPAVTITTGALPATTSTAPLSTTIAASGGTGAITFTVTGLPAWLSMTPQGALSGIAPVVSGLTDFSFSVTATDSVGVTTSKNFIATVNPIPSVTTTLLPAGTIGAPYSAQLAATGGTGALTWSAQGLPNWATLNAATGAIAGTPTAAASTTITLTATDSLSIASPAASVVLKINAAGGTPSVSTFCPLPTTTAGLSFNQNVIATGGTPPYAWSATGLPPWLSISSAGLLSGVAVAGSTPFTLQVSDSKNQTTSLACGLTVNGAPTITTGSLAPGTIGAPYAQKLNAIGGTGQLIWSATASPAWLTLDPLTGTVTGTPSGSGTYNLTVKVTDSLGAASAPASFTISITSPGGVPVLTACPLPSGTVGTPMKFQLTAALGFPPYNWSVSGLPAGLSANGAGLVTGTPTASAFASVNLAVTDSASGSASGSCFLDIAPAPTVNTSSLPDGTVGAPYWQDLSASGGIGPLHWSISGSPNWLMLDPNTGVLTGTPPTTGVNSFSVKVTDSLGAQSKSASLSVNVGAAGGTFAMVGPCPAPITQGVLVSQPFTARGGFPPYSYTGSGLPASLVLNSSGVLLGTPAAGTISFSIRATDQQQQQTTPLACSLVVNPLPSITTTSLPGAVAGSPYTANLALTGGSLPITWSAALPYWLSIDPQSGTLTGTPPGVGNASVVIWATDAYGISSSKSYTIAINPPGTNSQPALTSSCPLPGASAGMAYSFALTAGGGSSPYQFSVSDLPAGLTSSSTGAISGTPLSGGTSQVVIQIVDSRQAKALATCALSVTPAAGISISASTPDGKVGQSYSGGLTAAGGVLSYTWSVSAGTLPPGLVLNSSSGALTGTPTTAGAYSFTAKVTDAASSSATASASINISSALVITTGTALPGAVAGTAYRQALSSSGAVGNTTWTLTSGALPTGITLDATAGVISGSATQVGSFQFTIQAADSSSQKALQQFTLAVTLPPLPALTITGLAASVNPNQQLTAGVTLAAAFPVDVTGQLSLSTTAAVGATDPAVQFSAGGTSVPFKIPANSTTAVFTPSGAFQTGTLAETITLSVSGLQAAGTSIQTPAGSSVSGAVAKLAPVITGTPVVTRTASGLQVAVIVFSDTREATSANFHFTGTNVQTSDVTVPLSSLVGAWFSSSQSNAYGGSFQFVQPFTTQGSNTNVTGVTITITNSVGTSAPVTVSF